jgi:hypothetical protein
VLPSMNSFYLLDKLNGSRLDLPSAARIGTASAKLRKQLNNRLWTKRETFVGQAMRSKVNEPSRSAVIIRKRIDAQAESR